MDIRRPKRAVLTGVVATGVILGLVVVVVVLDLCPSGSPHRNATVDLQVVIDNPDYY
jgi:hypothetical protein